jgi:hypothetical protein
VGASSRARSADAASQSLIHTKVSEIGQLEESPGPTTWLPHQSSATILLEVIVERRTGFEMANGGLALVLLLPR